MPTNFELECWYTKQEYFYRRTKHDIGKNTNGFMQTLNTIVKNIQTHLKKHKMTYPLNV